MFSIQRERTVQISVIKQYKIVDNRQNFEQRILTSEVMRVCCKNMSFHQAKQSQKYHQIFKKPPPCLLSDTIMLLFGLLGANYPDLAIINPG